MGLPLTHPQLLCPWTLLGTPLHTPRHVPLVSHLLQNSARTNSQNDHLIITLVKFFVSYHLKKCNNEVIFLHLYQIGIALNSALKTVCPHVIEFCYVCNGLCVMNSIDAKLSDRSDEQHLLLLIFLA